MSKSWEQCIKNLSGASVEITYSTGINTVGKQGSISKFDKNAGKYEIHFEGGWCGWYPRKDFKLI